MRIFMRPRPECKDEADVPRVAEKAGVSKGLTLMSSSQCVHIRPASNAN